MMTDSISTGQQKLDKIRGPIINNKEFLEDKLDLEIWIGYIRIFNRQFFVFLNQYYSKLHELDNEYLKILNICFKLNSFMKEKLKIEFLNL